MIEKAISFNIVNGHILMGHMHGVYTNVHGQRIMSCVDLVCRYVTVSSKEHLVHSHHGYFPRLNVYTLGGAFCLVYLIVLLLHQ